MMALGLRAAIGVCGEDIGGAQVCAPMQMEFVL